MQTTGAVALSPTQRVMDLTLTQTSVIYNLVCVIPSLPPPSLPQADSSTGTLLVWILQAQ